MPSEYEKEDKKGDCRYSFHMHKRVVPKVKIAVFMGERRTSLSSLVFEISFRVLPVGETMHRACLNMLYDSHNWNYIFKKVLNR